MFVPVMYYNGTRTIQFAVEVSDAFADKWKYLKDHNYVLQMHPLEQGIQLSLHQQGTHLDWHWVRFLPPTVEPALEVERLIKEYHNV